MNAPFRLTPVMASRKVAALSFVRGFIEQHNRSPSYAEIGHALDVGRAHAKRVIRALVKDGALHRVEGGRRGIELPDRIAEAVRLLEAAGVRTICADDLVTAEPTEDTNR